MKDNLNKVVFFHLFFLFFSKKNEFFVELQEHFIIFSFNKYV